MEYEYLSSEGSLLPKSFFHGCMYMILFTKHKCEPCKRLVNILNSLDLTKYTNVALVVVSMDSCLSEWDLCKKPTNWLYMPFYPEVYKKKLFSKFKVNSLPFITFADNDTWINVPRNIVVGKRKELIEYIEYCISCFNIEHYELL